MELIDARAGAAAFLETVDTDGESWRLAPGDEHVADIGWAWVVAWSTAGWFETGQGGPPAGGGPIVVVKATGDTWMLTSQTPYDEQLTRYADRHGAEHTIPVEPDDAGRQAAVVLAEWLTAQSPAPWTPADLARWRSRAVRDWTLFEMPGFSNTMFLVRGPVVFEFQPGRMSVDEALAAAGTSG